MKKSVIIQKLIKVGQMLERGKLEYSGAEAHTIHLLKQYAAFQKSFDSGSLRLDKLRQKLDEALEKETPETLIKWLEEKRK